VADAPEAPEGKKKSSLLKYIILLVLLLLLSGGGYFAYLKFFAAPPPSPTAAEGENPADDAGKAADRQERKAEEKKADSGHGEAKSSSGHGGKDKAPSNTVSMTPFVVNLADTNARRYLKLVIEVEAAGSAELIEANQAKIRDALLMLLSSKTSQDLNTLEGKILLRKEIVDRLNQTLGQSKVARVYFTDFVIQ